jgi:hypothetical protein
MPAAGDTLKCSFVLLTSFTHGDKDGFEIRSRHKHKTLWAMITIKMRLLIIIIVMTFLSDTFGQISGYDFIREDLKGYKKVTSISTNYNGRDSSSYSSIYFVNEFGDITKSEHYDNKELTQWTKYEYYDNGLLKYEENHSPIFSYDEKTKKEIGQIKDDIYHGKMFEYNGILLTKVTYIDCYEGSKTYDYVILYEYDNSGRLVKEVSIDGNIGLTGEFKPNSNVIETLYNKSKVTRWTKNYVHRSDSIIGTEYDDNNEIQGYSFTKLSKAKKPIKILDTDSQKNGIKSVTRTYDKNENLTREIIEIIDIEKITYDMAAGDDYQLFYDNNSLPILGITREKGKIISKQIVRYK